MALAICDLRLPIESGPLPPADRPRVSRPRCDPKYSRAAKPVGSISVILDGNGNLVRRIKVSMDGPKSMRWRDYARWWWEQNRGPVPPGKRVCHLDGDTLNDDPANIGLLTAGDVVFLAHERDPRTSERNFAAMRVGAARFNRERAAARRWQMFFAKYWYSVDFAARVIYVEPRRQRWEIYALWGVQCDASSWRRARSAALGWPGINCMTACVLHVLADSTRIGAINRAAIVREVEGLRRLHGWRPLALTAGVLSSIVSATPWIRRRRGPRGTKLYWLDRAALAERNPTCKVIPVRGPELSSPRFNGFERRAAPANPTDEQVATFA